MVFRGQEDAPAPGELECVGHQVAADPQYPFLVTAEHLVGTVVRDECQPLGLRQGNEFCFQRRGDRSWLERPDVQLFLSALQPEVLQQLAGHGRHAPRRHADGLHVAFPVRGGSVFLQEFRAAAYRRQQGTQLMGDCLEDVASEMQQFPVARVALLQLGYKPLAFLLFPDVPPDFAADGEMAEHKQDDAREQGGGKQPDGHVQRLGDFPLPLLQGGKRLPVKGSDQPVQLSVQRPVTGLLAVDVGFQFIRSFPPEGGQVVAEGVQLLGIGHYLDCLFAAQRAEKVVPPPFHGTHAGGTFRHFGQAVDQEAVRRRLQPDGLHDT